MGEKLGFASSERRELNRRIGEDHRFQGEYVTRRWGDDLEAIHHFRLAGEHELADGLADGVAGFYYRVSNFAEANRLAQEVVERSQPPAPWWALNWFGMCQRVLGDRDRALQALKRALPLSPGRKERGTTLNNVSLIYSARGDYDRALECLQQSLKIQREIGDKSGEGTTLNNLATAAHARGDYDRALECLQQSLKIRREIGDKSGEGRTLNNISQIYDARGDYDRALECLQQSLKIRGEIGDKSGQIPTLHNLAHIALQSKDLERAMGYWSEALRLALETGNAQGIFHVAGTLGRLSLQSGNPEEGKRLVQMAVQVGERAGFPGVEELRKLLDQADAEASSD